MPSIWSYLSWNCTAFWRKITYRQNFGWQSTFSVYFIKEFGLYCLCCLKLPLENLVNQWLILGNKLGKYLDFYGQQFVNNENICKISPPTDFSFDYFQEGCYKIITRWNICLHLYFSNFLLIQNLPNDDCPSWYEILSFCYIWRKQLHQPRRWLGNRKYQNQSQWKCRWIRCCSWINCVLFSILPLLFLRKLSILFSFN